jgi:hypothetical protein
MILFFIYFSSASPSLGSSGGICDMATSSIGSFIFSSSKEIPKPETCLDSSARNGDEIRVREIIAQLKSTLSSIQSTVVSDLESVSAAFPAEIGEKKLEISSNEARTADLGPML